MAERGPRTPPAPEHLPGEAAGLWRRLAPELLARGALTAANRELLATYCDLVVRHHRAAEMLDAGLLVKRGDDLLVTNPAWRIYRDSAALLRAYARDLGLIPELS